MKTLRSMSKEHRIRTPFQGEFLAAKTQVWKAWAMVSNRFAVAQFRSVLPTSPRLINFRRALPTSPPPTIRGERFDHLTK